MYTIVAIATSIVYFRWPRRRRNGINIFIIVMRTILIIWLFLCRLRGASGNLFGKSHRRPDRKVVFTKEHVCTQHHDNTERKNATVGGRREGGAYDITRVVLTPQNGWMRSWCAGEGRKPGVFMNPQVIPTCMYCFLAWRERIESTHKKNTPRWNHMIINYFSI